MTGLKEFEEICKNLNWKWELIEDEKEQEAARLEYENMLAKYAALRLEVVVNAPDSKHISVTEMKKVEDVFRLYAPEGTEP